MNRNSINPVVQSYPTTLETETESNLDEKFDEIYNENEQNNPSLINDILDEDSRFIMQHLCQCSQSSSSSIR